MSGPTHGVDARNVDARPLDHGQDVPRQRISLRSRVTLLAAICVAGTVALMSLGAYVTVYNSLYRQIDDNMASRAEAVLNDRSVANSGGDNFPAFFFELSNIRFDLVDADGDSVLNFPSTSRPPIGADELRVAEAGAGQSFRTDARTDTRVFAVPYKYRAGVALVIAQPLAPTKSTLARLALVLIVISGSGIVVAALAGTAVAQGGLRPVQRLTQATERVARTGDLRPILVTGDDELARLTISFNSMLGTVADAQERQRRLVADAGHELRTPLTSLRTNLELLLSAERPGAPALAEADKAEIRDDLRAQLDELTQLIGDLVDLARDEGKQVRAEQVDLAEIVEQALDRAKRRAGDIEFVVDVLPWTLIGDPVALERAVLNLLDNAVKFSPPKGTVRVSVTPSGDGYALVQVADSGQGIADADLPHVFDRFYRSQEARALPGSGLGLAIVMQAAQRHGGTVFAGRAAEGGALLTMKLPGQAAV